MKTAIKEQARFDTRLPKEQKHLFEKAAELGGYRNLTEFIIFSAQEKAKEIINQREQILASQKDSKIFFNALINSKKPNKNLRNAFEEYKTYFSK